MDKNSGILIILNPIAGKGKAGERVPEIRRLMAEAGLGFELALTERVGHATELAAAACDRGYGVVVAAGGDGTVNEVVNGLMAAKAAGKAVPVLAAFSVGRGNDFAYGADLPGALEECVAVLARGEKRAMDVGVVRGGDYPAGKYFANGIGVGFDTIVGLEAAKMKRVHGFMAYVLGALKTFALFPDAPPRQAILGRPAPRAGVPADKYHERQAHGRDVLHGARRREPRRTVRPVRRRAA
ncbi:MAG TPA: diacylglycerol kinase family protein [Spirochaetia bacterium]|nr:diacylglycerol kinase family protein [Spirochaetales bacterium]HRW25354.1 diacylglycerol kinase family protein [Spirochaetia bacterium]